MLNSYLQQTQRFLRDQTQALLHPEDLVSYVNRARREIALRSQSIRVTPPTQGAVQSITVVKGGSGYTNPTVVITPPDSPGGRPPFPGGAVAIAEATIIGGVINSVNVVFGGDGYFVPTATVSDPTGSGAVLTVQTQPLNNLVFQQETYPFSLVPLDTFPGVDSIFAVIDVAVIYANYRYELPWYPYSVYQAMIRQYPTQYLYVPTMMTQFGDGTSGALMFYPLPSQPYRSEWDCLCLPSDLQTDLDFEALPLPWTDAVPYMAAHLAYLELQNANMARMYLEMYDNFAHRYSVYARPFRRTNPYGRY